jgi:hypothetical protein
MSEALEKIRAQHRPKHPHMGGGGSGGCRGCHGQTSEPCDVVRLAEALEDVLEDSRGYDAPLNRGLNSIQNAERTLLKVAGLEEDR